MTKKINLKSNLIYFIVVCLFVVIRICSNYGVFDFMGKYAGFVMGIVTQVGLIFLLPVILFKVLNKISFKTTFKAFSFKKISSRAVLVSILLGVVVFCINIYVSSFFNGVIQLFGYHPAASSPSSMPATWWVLLLNLFTTAFLPAICEETLHRGMLIRGFSDMSIKKTIFFSGLMFGLLHLNIEQFFYASLIGFFLGYLCLACNSIYPCMIVHFMNNAISVFLSFAAQNGWAIGNILNSFSAFMLKNAMFGFIFTILLLCLLVVIAISLTNFLLKDSFKYNFMKRQKELASKAIRENYFQQIEAIKNNDTQTDSNFTTQQNVVYINFQDFLEYVSKKMQKEKESKQEQPEEKVEDKNLDLKIKILLYGSIALSAIVTFMTFVWGLFR